MVLGSRCSGQVDYQNKSRRKIVTESRFWFALVRNLTVIVVVVVTLLNWKESVTLWTLLIFRVTEQNCRRYHCIKQTVK